MTPMQRSLAYLRGRGYHCEITEHWNPYAKIRNDLWGWCDILAVAPGGCLLAVQTTTMSNKTARVAKIRASKTYDLVRHLVVIEVHAWRKLKTGWECDVTVL